MSILIKGMEMPDKMHTIDICRDANGVLQANCGDGTGWHDVVEVPTHGRLIDADELLKRKGDCYDHDGHLLYAVGTGDIMLAPTVIEASEDGEQDGKL